MVAMVVSIMPINPSMMLDVVIAVVVSSKYLSLNLMLNMSRIRPKIYPFR